MDPSEPPPLPADMEIANLEHRLAFLKERQASGRRAAKRLLIFVAIAGPLGFVAVAATAIATSQDLAVVLFLLTLIVVILFLAYWILRWIVRGLNLTPDSVGVNKLSSYPMFLQAAINACEKRLSELKGQL